MLAFARTYLCETGKDRGHRLEVQAIAAVDDEARKRKTLREVLRGLRECNLMIYVMMLIDDAIWRYNMK
jgi:hypothetical protein